MQANETLKKMRETLMMHRRSRRTIKTYLLWIQQYMSYIKARPATETREDKIVGFLTFLAVKKHVSASTQKQAMCAIVYLYKRVLRIDVGDISAFTRSSRPQRIPTVFSQQEAWAVLDQLDGLGWLWGALMYGCGLRLGEVCSLRVKDIDIDRRQINVRDGKGGKDRIVPMPEMLVSPLEKHLRKIRPEYENYARRRVQVSLPDSLDRKYPNAPYEWAWFWLFAANGPVQARSDRQQDPAWIGKLYHIHDTAVQKRIGRAIRTAGINKRAGCHTFRHSYATHWLESAEGAHEVALLRLQRLLGHSNPKTTMIYLHCLKQRSDVPSPLDVRPEPLRHAA